MFFTYRYCGLSVLWCRKKLGNARPAVIADIPAEGECEAAAPAGDVAPEVESSSDAE